MLESYPVTVPLTEKEAKSVGANRWIRTNIKILLLLAGGYLAVMFAFFGLTIAFDSSILRYAYAGVAYTVMIVALIIWFKKMSTAGLQFLDQLYTENIKEQED